MKKNKNTLVTVFAFIAIAITLTLCFAPTVAVAETTNVLASADATIATSGGTLGTIPEILTGQNGQGVTNRALIRFDLSGKIPAGSVITSVVIRLTITDTGVNTSNGVYRFYPLTKDWEETSVNWRRASISGGNWTNQGGDYSTTSVASAFIQYAGVYSFTGGSNFISLVQSWANNATNNKGLVLISDIEPQTRSVKKFASREVGGANQPVLVVGYTTKPLVPKQPVLRVVGRGSSTLNVVATNVEPVWLYQLQGYTGLSSVWTNYPSPYAITNGEAIWNFPKTSRSGLFRVLVH